MKLKTAVAVNFPRLSDDPELQAAKTKLTELQTTFNPIERELVELLHYPATKANSTDRMAEALLDGGALPEGPAAAREERVSTLYDQKRILHRAIELQRERIEELRASKSKAIAASLVPAHRELVRAQAVAAVGLAQTREAEWIFRENLTLEDISYSSHLTPMPFPGIGRISDDYSTVSLFLRECVTRGYLTERELERVKAGETI
jgi:hypothetical protein